GRVYLAALQEAYRDYIKELMLAKQEATAQLYLTRLRLLDPGAILDFTLTPPPAATQATAATAKPATAPVPPPTIRLKGEDKESDPFDPKRAAERPRRDPDVVSRAEQEFSSRHYREARSLYEQAHQTDANLSQV